LELSDRDFFITLINTLQNLVESESKAWAHKEIQKSIGNDRKESDGNAEDFDLNQDGEFYQWIRQ
jgi:hypothetical protein